MFQQRALLSKLCSRNAFFCSRKAGPKPYKFAVKSKVCQPRRRQIPAIFGKKKLNLGLLTASWLRKNLPRTKFVPKMVVPEQNLFQKKAPGTNYVPEKSCFVPGFWPNFGLLGPFCSRNLVFCSRILANFGIILVF